MRQTSEVKAIPASEAPISVVLHDQSLRRLDDASRQWNPAKIRDDDAGMGFGDAGKLHCGLLAIEPMPTLARRNNVRNAARQRNSFRRPDLVFNRYGGGDVESPGLIEKPGVGVNSDDPGAPKSESAGESSRASSNVNDGFSRSADSERGQSVKEGIGKPGAELREILRSRSEVCRHLFLHRTVRTAPSLFTRALRGGGFRQHFTVHRVLEPGDEHLVPTLLAPKNFFVWSGIVAVLDRVVVVGEGDQFAAGGNLQRLGQFVMELPIEVELRHVEQYLLAAVGPDESVFDVLAAQMHVRREGVKRDRLLNRHLAGDLPVVDAGRDVGNAASDFDLLAVDHAGFAQLLAADVYRIARAFREDFVRYGLFGEPEAEPRAVLFWASARLVVHVELDVHPRQDAFGRARMMPLEAFARRLSDQLERAGSRERILAQENLARSPFGQASGLASRLVVESSGGRAVGADGLAVHDFRSFGKAD